VELSKNEIHVLEQATALHSDVFTNTKSKIDEEYFMQFQANGDCYFLNQHHGRYSCGVYEARPGICKNYPAKPGQKEACYAHRGKSLSNNPG
jgi:Fe-S-cluster containining protein